MAFFESIQKVKNAQLRFILAELAAGMTFASIAEGEGAKGHSLARARAAYDSVLRFLDRVPLTPEESREVRGRLEALKNRLESLND